MHHVRLIAISLRKRSASPGWEQCAPEIMRTATEQPVDGNTGGEKLITPRPAPGNPAARSYTSVQVRRLFVIVWQKPLPCSGPFFGEVPGASAYRMV